MQPLPAGRSPRQSLLDSPPEALFDDLTALAVKVLSATVALVSIVDETRQFFKSQFGLPEPVATGRETPLSHSFCKHVAASGEALVVEDARAHPLVKDNPVIEALGVAAYLGMPLFDESGMAYGAFCVIDSIPRVWTEREAEIVKALAAQVMSEIALRDSALRRQTGCETLGEPERSRGALDIADRHDLRTPLHALTLGIQALELAGPVNEEQGAYLRLMERNASALSAIIDRMPDIGGADGGRRASMLHKVPVFPSQLVQRAAEQVKPLAEDKSQTLSVGPVEITTPSPVAADTDKTVRVLVNLMANAVKFTPRGGHVRVSAFERVERGGRPAVCFEVSDNGRGILPEHLERIFEEGFRVDASGVTRRSTGLGLTFCKRIAEAHGGRVEVESAPGEGSVFRLYLPAAPSA